MSRLAGRKVLVVEDEYFIADDLAQELQRAGATVFGPVNSREAALALIAEERPDLVSLDINLKGDASFELADMLVEWGIDFIFATGYDAETLPPRHAGRRLLRKPSGVGDIIAALEERLRS